MNQNDNATTDELGPMRCKEAFRKQYGEALGMTEWTLEEQLRKRRSNGLIESGAVVEKLKTRPNQQRFKVLIHVRKYARWLTDPDGAVRDERESTSRRIESDRHDKAALTGATVARLGIGTEQQTRTDFSPVLPSLSQACSILPSL